MSRPLALPFISLAVPQAKPFQMEYEYLDRGDTGRYYKQEITKALRGDQDLEKFIRSIG